MSCDPPAQLISTDTMHDVVLNTGSSGVVTFMAAAAAAAAATDNQCRGKDL